MSEPAMRHSMSIINLGVADLDASIDQLSDRGLAFAHPPIEVPWGRFTSFDDPDGNGWVLQQSRGA